MKIIKYNNSLDHDSCFYEATLELSKDGSELVIYTKRIITARKYIGTTDPKEVILNTKLHNQMKKGLQIRKRRHR